MGSFGNDRGRFVFLGYFAALGAALLGGLLPSVSKPLLDLVNPLFFTTIVSFAPAILFTPISLHSKDNKHIRKQGYAILAASAIGSGLVAPYIYFVGLKESTASDAALLGNGEMVFTVLVATMFFGERLSRKGFLALTLLAFGIVAVITDLQFSASVLNLTAPGHVLILAATFLWGVDNNVTSAITERVDVARIIQIKSIISGAGLFAIAYLLHELVVKNLSDLLYVFIFGIFVFSGTAFLSIQSLKRLGPITTTIVFPMTSVFGLIFAYVLLGENITILQVGSVIVILLGIYLLTRPGSVIREGINLEQI
ncbi:MAG TPA: DMT family transporter [Nitrososphaerales archaeon]|nr:DMT family transporter [Nitrososphaerales archaeon]